jgi:hypothetical protein
VVIVRGIYRDGDSVVPGEDGEEDEEAIPDDAKSMTTDAISRLRKYVMSFSSVA